MVTYATPWIDGFKLANVAADLLNMARLSRDGPRRNGVRRGDR